MKKSYLLLSLILIFIIVIFSLNTFNSSVILDFWLIKKEISIGLLIILLSSFSFLSSLGVLIGLDLSMKTSDIKAKNKIDDAKLKQEIEIEKVKQLEAKIKTLEEAIKKLTT